MALPPYLDPVGGTLQPLGRNTALSTLIESTTNVELPSTCRVYSNENTIIGTSLHYIIYTSCVQAVPTQF
ncbi:uncharacterized protein BJ212DRAFT_1368885 [Suillus subaureus]|uniref:Uncharacterized protein n=1 Tax=Suillus subaureus TaxID=48587 RepID=A0A9P7JBM9_9AGAM|nr:uncharacterized protein BJ212DRAFT_1368885 [Suillus subaureus]KAG1812906.1 hypothetical protein BJ212DRAFT_1368885 [Suillus subaureus]